MLQTVWTSGIHLQWSLLSPWIVLNSFTPISYLFTITPVQFIYLFVCLSLVLIPSSHASITWFGFLSSTICTTYPNHFNCFILIAILHKIFLIHLRVFYSSPYLALYLLLLCDCTSFLSPLSVWTPPQTGQLSCHIADIVILLFCILDFLFGRI